MKLKRYSETAQRLVELKDEILQVWSTNIRREVKAARFVSEPILIDTVPAYIENLAEALSPDFTRKVATDFTTIAEEHGGERARVTDFNVGDIIREYQILKDAILLKLGEKVKPTTEEDLIIRLSIDSALRQAVGAYAIVQSQAQQNFVASVTHDLRVPMGLIQTAVEIAMEEAGPESPLQDLLRRIQSNAVRADQLVRQLLDTSSIRASGGVGLKIEACEILRTIQLVAEAMNPKCGDRIHVSGTSVHGYWDVDALRRTVENLVSNAIKYGDSKGPITIEVSGLHDRLNISVHNTGEPIPDHEREAIFQVFRRAEAARAGVEEGWGLGLALVRSLAEAHGGSVYLDRDTELGARFVIDLPRDARPFQNKS